MIVNLEAKVIDIIEKSYESKGETHINKYVKVKQNLETLELRLSDDCSPEVGHRYLIKANYVRRFNQDKNQFYIFWDLLEVDPVC